MQANMQNLWLGLASVDWAGWLDWLASPLASTWGLQRGAELRLLLDAAPLAAELSCGFGRWPWLGQGPTLAWAFVTERCKRPGARRRLGGQGWVSTNQHC
jgi:hypothetical protein